MPLYSRNIKRTASNISFHKTLLDCRGVGTASLSSLCYPVRYLLAYKVIFKVVDNLKDGFEHEEITKHKVVYDTDTRLVLLEVIGTQ